MTRWWMACLLVALGTLTSLPAAAQPTAAEIVAQSVKAHGGDALTSWQTLKITGTVVMQDGIAYTGAYTLLAKAPDRLRVEHDATADRGRAFYDYVLNGGVAWSRRNLIPGALEVDRIQRWMDQCYGIAFYARPGVTLERLPDAGLAWPPQIGTGAAAAAAPGETRRVWVVAATVGTERRELFIDQDTARLLQEVDPAVDPRLLGLQGLRRHGDADADPRDCEDAAGRVADAIHVDRGEAERAHRRLAVHRGHAAEVGAAPPQIGIRGSGRPPSPDGLSAGYGGQAARRPVGRLRRSKRMFRPRTLNIRLTCLS